MLICTSLPCNPRTLGMIKQSKVCSIQESSICKALTCTNTRRQLAPSFALQLQFPTTSGKTCKVPSSLQHSLEASLPLLLDRSSSWGWKLFRREISQGHMLQTRKETNYKWELQNMESTSSLRKHWTQSHSFHESFDFKVSGNRLLSQRT